MPKKNKKTTRQKSIIIIWLEFIPFLLLYSLVRAMPLKIAYLISKSLFRLLYLIDGKHRNRAIEHIMHAKVRANKKDAAILARASFSSYAKLLVEIIKSDQCYSLDKTNAVGCQATIDRVFNHNGNNQNVILVTAHYGNWEVAGTAIAEYTGIKMASIMRPFGNPLIGEIILKNRASDIHDMVPKQGGIKGILKALKKNRIATFLVDQHASARDGGVETIFFGQPCRTHTAPALLHLKTGVPIMPQLTRRVDDNFGFEFILSELIEYTPTGDKEQDVKNITQLYTTALEKMIIAHPEQWMWVHRRWLNLNR